MRISAHNRKSGFPYIRDYTVADFIGGYLKTT